MFLSSVTAFGGRSKHREHVSEVTEGEGFVCGSNTHFIRASYRKLKHDRSNTGLNAFSSFLIFSFRHIRLVSVLSRLCNGKLLQKRSSFGWGQRVIADVTLKVTSGK